MLTKIVTILFATTLAFGTVSAQTPTPIVVQAVIPVGTTTIQPQAGPAASVQSVLQTLQAMKSANDEILKKQAATLLQLDEIQKAAEQLKIYSKRG
jgi:hypothetical protein